MVLDLFFYLTTLLLKLLLFICWLECFAQLAQLYVLTLLGFESWDFLPSLVVENFANLSLDCLIDTLFDLSRVLEISEFHQRSLLDFFQVLAEFLVRIVSPESHRWASAVLSGLRVLLGDKRCHIVILLLAVHLPQRLLIRLISRKINVMCRHKLSVLKRLHNFGDLLTGDGLEDAGFGKDFVFLRNNWNDVLNRLLEQLLMIKNLISCRLRLIHNWHVARHMLLAVSAFVEHALADEGPKTCFRIANLAMKWHLDSKILKIISQFNSNSNQRLSSDYGFIFGPKLLLSTLGRLL